jgi:hypothetical protein
MKKPFKKSILGKVLVGVGDAFTGGSVSNMVYQDENAPAGSMDWKRACASIATVALIAAFAMGKITLADLQQLLQIVGQ